MRSMLLAILLAPLTVLADGAADPQPTEKPTEKPPEEPKSDSPFAQGRFVLRGGANFDVNQSINLGGSSQAGNPTIGVHGGVGYFPVTNLEAGVDLNFYMGLNPVAVHSLELTPGVRYWLMNMIQLRVGVPIPIVPRLGLGLLAGAGYRQPIGSRAAFVLGVDYTYWLTESYRAGAPLGRLDVHAGVQTWF